MSDFEKLVRVTLTQHQVGRWSKELYCNCGAYLGDYAGHSELIAHQAEMLIESGFGDVRELQGRVDAGLAALDDPRVGKTAKALIRAAITATEGA